MWLHFDGTIQAKLLCPDVDPLREVRRKHFYRYLWHYVPSPASFCKLIFHSFHNCCKFFTAIKWHRDLNKWPRYLASHPTTTGPPNRILLTEKSFSQVVCIWLVTQDLLVCFLMCQLHADLGWITISAKDIIYDYCCSVVLKIFFDDLKLILRMLNLVASVILCWGR